MAGPRKRDARYDRLMHDVCVRYGFCGRMRDGKLHHVNNYLPDKGPVTADQFAEWVVLAEQGDSEAKVVHGQSLQDIVTRRNESAEDHDKRWRAVMRDLFVNHMGAAVVDVSELNYSDRICREQMEFRVDDLSGAEMQALVARHLRGMQENSPPTSVHAFGIEKLRQPGVTVWSAWVDGRLAAMGALKRLDAASGEIKSMRVADSFLGRGLGRAMLEHILAEARAAGMTSLWLETGSTPDFEPALKLYESAGFAFCGPFGDYKLDPFSRFMTRVV